jgi:hypothetical protein
MVDMVEDIMKVLVPSSVLYLFLYVSPFHDKQSQSPT